MAVSGLLALLSQVKPYQALLDRVADASFGGGQLGVPRCARASLAAALHRDLGRPMVVVVPRVDQAQKLTEELTAWSPTPQAVLRFLEPTPLPYDRAPWGERSRNGRLSVLGLLQSLQESSTGHSAPPMIIVSARALAQQTLPPGEFSAHTHRLRVGQAVRLSSLLESWLAAGYRPATVVEEPGAFCRRGGILDVCPPGSLVGVRVELYGDEVESLRSFDLTTQRTLAPLETALVSPACEALPEHGPRVAQQLAGAQATAGKSRQALSAAERDGDWREDLERMGEGVHFPGIEFYSPYFLTEPASLLDYLPAEALLLVDDWDVLETEFREIGGRASKLRTEREREGALPPAYPSPIHDWSTLSSQLRACRALRLGGLSAAAEEGLAPGRDDQMAELAAAFVPGPRFGGQVKPLMKNLARLHFNGERAVVVSRQAARLAELWAERGPAQGPVSELREAPAEGTLTFVQGVLGDGFTLRGRMQEGGPATLVATKPTPVFHLFTDAEIFGWSRPEPRQVRRPRAAAPETHYADISPGGLVVHIDHGIGRYGGLVTKQIAGVSREYLLVTYAQEDQLYVPVHQADRLGRYIGPDDSQPTLHRLGGISWAQTRARAKREVEEIADELLEMCAARATVQGHAFSPDTPWQAELEASFPYLETDDQLQVLADVKQDMEQPRPMDRLICGDVGYGKTEVALRAAFKAVMDGMQVAVLVPTTILAQQHYTTFSRRLAAFPVEVRMLSRFRSRKEQSRILRELRSGKADIVIGTHRLLQKDVSFNDLGLLIVDEEQRFGVAHKEMTKRMRTEVDVLTMTATPIPRTLYLSLSGVRDISLINTPPEERLPVHTHVGAYDRQLIRRAILRELDRGGQAFFVHNRVLTIDGVARRLQALVPEARFAVGHGQMSERQLEQVMLDFVAGEVDVLVSTSIIENGLDIPNANTMIVDRADMFGLAQLYQFRGRVGRGARRAYAYFFSRGEADLTPEARARLETIAEHTELGAGYSIAMRDLEIRGAGEILGARQHGHIAAIGFDLYTRLLARAVQQRREEVGERAPAGAEAKPILAPLPDIVTIELPLDAYVPPDYIEDAELRFRLYRRMAALPSLESIDEMAAELADRFGPIPDAVDSLLYQLRVRLLASRAGALSVVTLNQQISIRMEGLEETNRQALQRNLGPDVRVSRKAVWLRPEEKEPARLWWQVRLVQVLERLADWPG